MHVTNTSACPVDLCVNEWHVLSTTQTGTQMMLTVFSASAVSIYEDMNTYTSSPEQL